MNVFIPAIASAAMIIVGCASTYRIVPIENPPATVRYDRGAPTTSLELRNGAVQVTPMHLSDGKLVFGVAAYNNTDWTANFGVENIQARAADRQLRVFTADDLIREARNKAIAASVALALLGAAGAAASQAAAHQTYNSSFYTPRGAYHYRASYYDAAGAAAGTAASIGGATAGIVAVNRSLDAAIAGIGESVLQTTTVDPGETVAGRVLVQKSRSGTYPQEVSMNVRWNDEDYPFRFQVTRSNGRGSSPTDPPRSSAASLPRPPSPTVAVSTPPPPPTTASTHEQVSASPTEAPTNTTQGRPTATRSGAGPVAPHEDDDAYNERMWKEQARFEQ